MRDWKEWFKAAGIRALRTFGQSAVAYIGTSAVVLSDVNWLGVLSAGAMGAVLSFLMALSGLPETKDPFPDDSENGLYGE